jgi:hypothetical protein
MSATIKINDEEHVLIVLKVLDYDSKGRPSKVEIGYDDTTHHLVGGERFITAFAHKGGLDFGRGN